MTARGTCVRQFLSPSLSNIILPGSVGRVRSHCGAGHRRVQSGSTSMSAIKGCTFEVFGKVQGVYFRDSTKKKADSIGILGFCRNTANNTVAGEMQGEPAPFYEMKEWLKHEGSPASQIEDCKFGTEKDLDSLTFKSFDILR